RAVAPDHESVAGRVDGERRLRRAVGVEADGDEVAHQVPGGIQPLRHDPGQGVPHHYPGAAGVEERHGYSEDVERAAGYLKDAGPGAARRVEPVAHDVETA